MQKLELTVRFNTPAFLGNAEQNGQWRTPPFKALLRQWWRITAANGFGYDSERLRIAEGRLFGTAGDGESRQSAIRLRLDRWDEGKLKRTQWQGVQEVRVSHPEVTNQQGQVMRIGAELYLGYGPLVYQQGATSLRANAAIQADESAKLNLAWPKCVSALSDTLQLVHWFGNIGGRSRNGWGSLALFGQGIESVEVPKASDPLINRISLSLDQCLRRDWPHALGKDERGLMVWKSQQEFATWRDAMTGLAKAKIGFRTSLKFTAGRNGPFESRHLLAYPVTNHNVGTFPREARLGNQLRFKVVKTAKNGKFTAIIFHLPCALPHELAQKLGASKPSSEQQAAIWSRVHAWLDASASGFQRI
jgi:CRISPR-associated protein Cmr1